MEPRDYHLWKQMQNELKLSPEADGIFEGLEKMNTEEELDDEVFEAVSKRAWTDILLQILKVCYVTEMRKDSELFYWSKKYLPFYLL